MLKCFDYICQNLAFIVKKKFDQTDQDPLRLQVSHIKCHLFICDERFTFAPSE